MGTNSRILNSLWLSEQYFGSYVGSKINQICIDLQYLEGLNDNISAFVLDIFIVFCSDDQVLMQTIWWAYFSLKDIIVIAFWA